VEDVWVPVTLLAATLQVLRTSRQHELRRWLSPTGAGFVRYLYGAPLAWTASLAWFALVADGIPSPSPTFWTWLFVAAISQIVATVALLRSFRLRDFAIGTAYAKTEVIQVAVLSAALLGEALRPVGWAGALICTGGVVWLATDGAVGGLLRRALDPAALFGVVAGGLFGLAALGIRGASSALGDAPAPDRALLTLTLMLTVQTGLNAAYLLGTDRRELAATVRAWRAALPVGVLSLAGSAGWALAVTLEQATKVRTLGQVELLLAFLIARRRHGDVHTAGELLASATVLGGIVVVAALG
jgi:drug/metabolite transporter (DMT)-like permease